jgi:hypothetical protein
VSIPLSTPCGDSCGYDGACAHVNTNKLSASGESAASGVPPAERGYLRHLLSNVLLQWFGTVFATSGRILSIAVSDECVRDCRAMRR